MPTIQLKRNDNFIPCPVVDGDEIYPNGIFEFNITRMLSHIQANPDLFIPEPVPIADFYPGVINEDHIDIVDVTRPIILAEISPNNFNVIDGNHRVEKARKLGMKSIMAYKLSVEQHVKFLTSRESYLRYVDYWNGKMNQ